MGTYSSDTEVNHSTIKKGMRVRNTGGEQIAFIFRTALLV